MAAPIVLASGSIHRRRLLEHAGLAFTVQASELDERLVEAPLLETGAPADDVATVLAEAKAQDVAGRTPGGVVIIGADQTLSLEGELLHKPAGMEEARRTLLKLSGRTHELHSAIALVRDGETVFRHVETARITFRELTPPAIGHYLAKAGNAALDSVGAYQVEGPGIQLMERIDGDFFTIVGMPMLPLLAALRRLGALDE